jgi:conjugative transposon TraM protein
MMQTLNKSNGDDPEIKQLDGALEKILDIQHPERVKDRIKEKSLKNKEVVFPITKTPKEESISLLDTGKKNPDKESAFFGLSDESSFSDNDNAIEAVIHENQILVNGAVVKLRLLNDLYINGSLIPKGNFVFGIASLNGERLEVEINSIRYNQSLYPVKLSVYDIDGLHGIYIPGAITRDVAKQSVDNSLQLMELSTMDPSFKAQAATAGIGAAKSLLSKKVKQVKVMVKAGYKVLLKDKNI